MAGPDLNKLLAALAELTASSAELCNCVSNPASSREENAKAWTTFERGFTRYVSEMSLGTRVGTLSEQQGAEVV